MTTRRRIADPSKNRFLAEDLPDHRPTSSVPESFLRPLDPDLQERIAHRFSDILGILNAALGRPYFARNGFILYQGDCVQVLDKLASTCLRFNLTVTSPPYNIGKEYEAPLPVEEYINWCSRWLRQISSTTSASGALWLNVGYLEVSGAGLCVPIPYLLWDKTDLFLLQEVVWNYGAGVSTKSRLSPRNEKWLFYVKDPKNYTFNLDDIRDPNVKYPNQKRNGKFRCHPLGKNPSDVWNIPKVTTGRNRSSRERTEHPAQFPLRLVERIVLASSNPAECVLDPFAGSASAGLAAIAHGRIFVGIERNEAYCRMAVERFEGFQAELESSSAQRNLFHDGR